MASGSNSAITSDSDSIPSLCSDSPRPVKKQKIEEEPKIRKRLEETDDPECLRQKKLFFKQVEDSEGFDLDWESFDYRFNANVFNFDWAGPLDDEPGYNDNLMETLIQEAIQQHDDQYGTQLAFGKYVSANLVPVKGLMYYITYSAKDLTLPNQEHKLYQAKVWKFCDEISVELVRPRPAPQGQGIQAL